MRQRVITGALLLLGAGALLALSGWYFLAATGLLALLAFGEWARLVYPRLPRARRIYVAFGALLLALGAWYCGLPEGAQAGRVGTLMIAALAWWLVALVLVAVYPRGASLWRTAPLGCLMGVAVLLPCWLGVVFLRGAPGGVWLVAGLLLAMALLDSAAYFGGRRFGKRALAPALSPAKTWEGALCGVLALLLAALVLSRTGWFTAPPAALLGGALLVALAGILGDLVESALKRACGVKDSARLLPGHGGVLDRIDSLSAATPVYTLCLLAAARL